jgi:O-antigen biosynthesis protein
MRLRDAAEIDAFAEQLAREHSEQVREVNRLVGFCLMIHRDALAHLGPLDERFGVGNFEDDDYCTRARQAGYRLMMAKDCFVYHHGGRTFAGMGLEGKAFREL